MQKSDINNQVGKTPVIFSGKSQPKPTDGEIYKNLVTITGGSLSVCTNDNSGTEIIMDAQKSFLYDTNDPSGGILWVQKQLLIGKNKAQRGWATIDIDIEHSPALFIL